MSAEDYRGEVVAENRQYPRKKLRLAVHYHCIDDEKACLVETASENISFGGIALRGEKMMITGQLLMVTLFIPSEKMRKQLNDREVCREKDCTPVNALSRVAWCQPGQSGFYGMGLQFLHLVVEDRRKMEDFAQDFQLLSGDDPNLK